MVRSQIIKNKLKKSRALAKKAGVGLLTFFMLKGIGWLILLYLGVEIFT